ncbi:hypothetical protein NECAME_15027 [Necator americanus]|uniref:ERAP1-like C-terminal domain-containing protein n=1 Tax=Necator americanus TaxID=51031 RepID=W2SLY9_NECAM|nr:hypothetical protein NECAME_15027 [Necator americanus]ETN69871.1 hypothetical protein NECAME_15027 [Necator americanus]
MLLNRYAIYEGYMDMWLETALKEEPLYLDRKEAPIVINVDRRGYFVQNYDFDGWKRIIRQFDKNHKVYSPHTRYTVISDAFNAALIGRLDYRTVFALLKYLSKEEIKALYNNEDNVEEKDNLAKGLTCANEIQELKTYHTHENHFKKLRELSSSKLERVTFTGAINDGLFGLYRNAYKDSKGNVKKTDFVEHYLKKFSFENTRGDDLWKAFDEVVEGAEGPDGGKLSMVDFGPQWSKQVLEEPLYLDRKDAPIVINVDRRGYFVQNYDSDGWKRIIRQFDENHRSTIITTLFSRSVNPRGFATT